ncbi:hypothetical protein B0H13DRAFT_2344022 [Mycena leptocephala]|nr:hypothetical protein B0H13DRAFT_2344022 [Mycena leptocephala]
MGLNDGCYARQTAAEGRVKGGPYLVRTTSVIHGESEDLPCARRRSAPSSKYQVERNKVYVPLAYLARLLRCWLSSVGWEPSNVARANTGCPGPIKYVTSVHERPNGAGPMRRRRKRMKCANEYTLSLLHVMSPLEYYIPFLPLIRFSSPEFASASVRPRRSCVQLWTTSTNPDYVLPSSPPSTYGVGPRVQPRILSATHTLAFLQRMRRLHWWFTLRLSAMRVGLVPRPASRAVWRESERPARVRILRSAEIRLPGWTLSDSAPHTRPATTRWDSGNEAADNHLHSPADLRPRTPPSAAPLVLPRRIAGKAARRDRNCLVCPGRLTAVMEIPTHDRHPLPTAVSRSARARHWATRCSKCLLAVALCLELSMVYLWGLDRYWGTVSFLPVPSWPVPSDVSIEHCARWPGIGPFPGPWNDFPQSAWVEYDLPLSDHASLFLLSRSIPGNSEFSHGDVTYQPVDGLPDSTVRVMIVAHYWNNKYIRLAKSCLIKRTDGEIGVGIFSRWKRGPWRHHPHEEIRFQIYVRFPRAPEPTITVNELRVDLEDYTQSFSIMADINFNHLWIENSKAISAGLVMPNHPPQALLARNVTLHSSGRIEIPSLVAEYAQIATSAGDIQGVYNASRSLSLFNSMGPLHADINLINDEVDVTPVLHLRTDDGGIQANINLVATNNIPSSAASYEITAQTRKGLLDVHIASAPVDSRITLGGWNIDGTVYVKFPPGYEGCYYDSRHCENLPPRNYSQREERVDRHSEERAP